MGDWNNYARLQAESQARVAVSYRQQVEREQLQWVASEAAKRHTAARALLGITTEQPSPEEIKAAFTAKVKESHPDAGGSGADMDALKQARDYLLSGDTVLVDPCPLCKGRGSVSSGFGVETCPTCKGTGSREHGPA